MITGKRKNKEVGAPGSSQQTHAVEKGAPAETCGSPQELMQEPPRINWEWAGTICRVMGGLMGACGRIPEASISEEGQC